METRLLSKSQLKEVYFKYLVNDFPPSERIPYRRLARLLKQGRYYPYGLYEGDTFIGYSFFVSAPGSNSFMADYLAILQEYRNKGFGAECLKVLNKNFENLDYVIFEVEDPAFAGQEEDRRLMERRIHFYTRNGMHFTKLKVCTFGVHYLIGYASMKRIPSESEIIKNYIKIYDSRLGSHLITMMHIKTPNISE